MIGNIYRYIMNGPHYTSATYAPTDFWNSDPAFALQQNDLIVVLHETRNGRVILIPNGAVRHIGYKFENDSDFVLHARD